MMKMLWEIAATKAKAVTASFPVRRAFAKISLQRTVDSLDKKPANVSCRSAILLVLVVFISALIGRPVNAADASVKLEFGNSSIVVDRGSILQILGAPNVDLKRSNEIRIPAGAVVTVKAPETVLSAYPTDCRPDFFGIYFNNERASLPEKNPTFRNVHATSTKYKGVETIEYETEGAGRILDLYRFTSDDLVDFSGRHITFYKGRHRFTTDIQVGDVFRVTAVSSEECFFENAEEIVRRIRSVVFGLTK